MSPFMNYKYELALFQKLQLIYTTQVTHYNKMHFREQAKLSHYHNPFWNIFIILK